MISSEVIEQINQYLDKSLYDSLTLFLERWIESEPEKIEYYWYLGLVYLLQERETEAQTTWFLVMSQGTEEEVEQWTQELLQILEFEAQRQETLGNLKLSWLIRGHIREISPLIIENLFELIKLELELKYYDPSFLERYKVVEYLKNGTKISINLELLIKILPGILDLPNVITLDFLHACLPFINDEHYTTCIIELIKLTAIKMAYERHLANYAVELTKFSLLLKPDDISLIDSLYWFGAMAKIYPVMLQSAIDFLDLATSPEFKAFGYYKLIRCQVSRGSWLEAQEILPTYLASMQEMLDSQVNFFEQTMRGGVHVIPSVLIYLQDLPQINRCLQNQFSALFQDFLPSWIPYSRQKINQCNVDDKHPRKLKIGYISHTLRRHSVGWLSRWLFHHHDRTRFHITLYLMSQPEDDITDFWFRSKVDNVYNLPDIPQQTAELIQQDEINILVDLDGTTHGATCKVLGLKPAPIQITWLGYDATGLPAMDYFIADPYVLPDGAEEYYRETIWRLPHTYLGINGFEVAAPLIKRDDLGIASDVLVYISVQTAEKRHPDTIYLQMQILKAVPNSYLLIKGRADQSVIQPLFQGIARECGVELDRIIFLDTSPSEETHRASLMMADVVLDTYPYNGATTTLEALWMGLPIVTKVGQQFAARNSYAFMTNAGLTEGIAYNDEEYINWGIRLGTDESLRQQIHWKLKQSRKTSPLWNAKAFTKNMEDAYEKMWSIYLNKISQSTVTTD